MRILIQIFLLMVLVGCASPFRTVYTSPEGGYYIEERAAQSGYYVPDSIMYAGIGFDPWWITANPSLAFIYYQPNYYQHYLSAWYRLIYQPYYGYYQGHYSYWCPPYRIRHGRWADDSGRVADNPVPARFIYGREMTQKRDLLRSNDYQSSHPAIGQGNGPVYSAPDRNRSITTFMNTPANSSLSAPAMNLSRSSGFASPSQRSISVGAGVRSPRLFPAPTKQ